MTITAADARPYQTRLRVPIVGLTTFMDFTAVDIGLSDAERDAVDSSKTRTTLIALSVAANLAIAGLVLAAANVVMADAQGWTLSIVTGLVSLTVGVPAFLLLRKRGQRIKSLTRQLNGRKDLHFDGDDYAFKGDLERIDAVLRAMHRRGDTSLDGQAREVVRKVMQRYDREPTAGQFLIARSKANDAATKAVRAAVKKRKVLVGEAVAHAELALTALEAAAATSGRQ